MNLCRRFFSLFMLACALGAPAAARAQTPHLRVNPETGETQAQFARRTKWWRDGKFGMFVHWGIYSVPSSDRRNVWNLGEWYMASAGMPVQEYEKYAAQFDPVAFNARDWVALAKAAGMKYITITAKHHDGFCMFDTKLTDYNVVKATPWHHDPMKDLAEECRRQGVKLCFYYSVKDWHNADYLPRIASDKRPTGGASLDRYIAYMEGQLRELLTNYGPIGGIWFDGHLDHTAQEEHATEVVKMMRAIQPRILINDRINLPEDYDTPEQVIPENGLPGGRLWETCLTINGHWGYAWNDYNFKSRTDLLRTLCDVVGKGGNLLLNVGPDSGGVIPAGEVSVLKQIGAWMDVNGESIYGTTQSPFRTLPFDGRCTQKGKTLYLQVFHWPEAGLTLPHLITSVQSAVALGGRERLPVRTLPDGTVTVGKPSRIDPAVTVVALHLRSAEAVDPASRLIPPQPDGSYALVARDAEIDGDTARLETLDNAPDDVGYWTNIKDTVCWRIAVPPAKAGRYRVDLEFACIPGSAGGRYRVAVDGAKTPPLNGTVGATANWDTYNTVTVDGTLLLPPGKAVVRITPQTMPGLGLMNVRRIVLTPLGDAE